ncbi:MAG: ribonuclease Z [Roseburia sp.]|nr:ribonuclease Z [Roseburia sp.]
MLDVCLLGTGGMMPLPRRWLTAALMRYNGSSLLVDCGEGTQIAMKEAGWSFKPIDVICFTHYHADHISGLPGLLLTMGNAERTEPLIMIGPKGLERVVNALRTIAPELPFEMKFIEITDPEADIELNGYHIHAFKVNHNITCYGYSVEIKRAGRFDVDRAKANNIPQRMWSRLQKGETISTEEGVVYTPDMVLGAARKGIKVTYCTDSRPTETIVKSAAGSDLFICEGMYAEKDKLVKAKQYKHMTFYEAADMAKRAEVQEMWLTHFSPSLVRPEEYMPEVREIFSNAYLGKDGKTIDLMFDENE